MPEKLTNPTNEKVRDKILKMGYDLNPMKGIHGQYYRESRIKDLKKLILEIIDERSDSYYV